MIAFFTFFIFALPWKNILEFVCVISNTGTLSVLMSEPWKGENYTTEGVSDGLGSILGPKGGSFHASGHAA